MISIQKHSNGFSFKVFVLPKSSKNMILGIYKDALKLKITAPPVDGAANKMCIQFLAKHLKLSKSCLEIISGKSGRTKKIFIHSSKNQFIQLKKQIESLTKSKKAS